MKNDISNSIKILILEDSSSDAELIQHELKKAAWSFTSKIVETREAFENALDSFKPDIILSDYSLPSFDGVTAFKIKQKKHSDIPFIIVSGTIGEENVVELIKNGITDYALKDKLYVLTSKITRALKEEEEKKEKRIADEKLKIEHELLIKAENQVRNFATKLNHTLEEERKRIAREIHDELGQQLTAFKMGIDWVLHKQTNTEGEVVAKLNELLKMSDTAVNSIRRISSDLRPAIIDDLGLIAAIEGLCNDFEERVGLACRFSSSVKERKFDDKFSINTYRIVQETLTNIVRHAIEAKLVTISISENETELHLEITDNGKGISAENIQNSKSLGIIGMKERATLLGGKLTIEGAKNKGTRTKLVLPLKSN